jgi:DNA sulfur modification protein DndD
MLLRRITLDNYGLYQGTISFDLSPREKYGKLRPVILFGGNNGAGKTTLFDAFRVVLYGKAALGDRVADSEYKQFLRNRIHKPVNGARLPQSASISLEFDYTALGETSRYIVTRLWVPSSGGAVERLSIVKDGNEIRGVNHDYWQGFIEEIIPERLSSLFFFDGEKIKNIADDAHGNEALAESIKALLGLDIVEKLSSDISIYKSREASRNATRQVEHAIKELERKVSESEEKKVELLNLLAANKAEQQGVQTEISTLELELKREGHVFAQRRDSLKEKKQHLESTIETIRKSIREECEGVYPFAFCPSLSAVLIEQIEKEQHAQTAKTVQEELRTLHGRLEAATFELPPQVQTHASNVFNRILEQRLDELRPQTSISNILGLSEDGASRIRHWVQSAASQSQPKVLALLDEQELAVRQLQAVERDLQKAPDEANLQPYMEQLSAYQRQLGAIMHQHDKLESELRSVEYSLGLDKRRLERVFAEASSAAESVKRLSLASKVQAAIADYADRLTKAKIEELRTTVAERFNALSRKGNLIRKIDIDPDTFAVTLLDRYGNVLPKEDLSAGEKQMYAVAMLWGLSVTSGRSLPIIIDTPLGRLDSEHRGKLIHNYFPCAAEQVIILSTDTEIDKQWYAELSPNLSHCYHLSYCADSNRTAVSNQYFWRG